MRLAKTALAEWSKCELADIEEVWHGLARPIPSCSPGYGQARGPRRSDVPAFRPLMLAHPLEEGELAAARLDGFRRRMEVGRHPRAGARIKAARGASIRAPATTSPAPFPMWSQALPPGAVLDGELLVMREGEVAPFNDLQQRLNRKTVTPAMLKSHPAHVRLYDMLFDGEEDLRRLPFVERRARLEAWHATRAAAAHGCLRRGRFRLDRRARALWAARARPASKG